MASAFLPYLRVDKAVVKFGATTILDGVDFSAGKGEFVSILGPSGCGKTTLLRLIAGFVRGEGGGVTLDGRDLTALAAYRRNIGIVFQNYALFPHLSVADNVAFGLRARKMPKAEVASAVDDCLELVRLADFADRPIQSLSGGQQQRVALARALAIKPSLLLFDEPFSALDRKLRESMQIELRTILRRLSITAIFVTHDQEEALIMSDRIAVMNGGVIEQFASPATLYDRPTTDFVLGFVGLSTRLAGRVIASDATGSVVATAAGEVRVPLGYLRGTEVVVGVRPERIGVGPVADEAFNAIVARLSDIVFCGARTQCHFETASDDRLLIDVDRERAAGLRIGSEATLNWKISDTLVFPYVHAVA